MAITLTSNRIMQYKNCAESVGVSRRHVLSITIYDDHCESKHPPRLVMNGFFRCKPFATDSILSRTCRVHLANNPSSKDRKAQCANNSLLTTNLNHPIPYTFPLSHRRTCRLNSQSLATRPKLHELKNHVTSGNSALFSLNRDVATILSPTIIA